MSVLSMGIRLTATISVSKIFQGVFEER